MLPLSFTAAVAIVCLAAPTAFAADAESEARISRLTSLLRQDASFKVRAYAARQLGALAGLGAYHHVRIVASLKDALTDDDPVVRAVAADSLARHGAVEALPELERMSRTEEVEVAQKASAAAAARLRNVASPEPVRHKKAQRVELGRVELEGGAPLTQVITDVIEELIEPHRPAMFPRESPDVRLEVLVKRVSPKLDSRGVGLAYEARVVMLQLPGAQLRRASNATATAHTTKRGSGALNALEKELAVKAATRAVTEALAMLDSD